MTHFGVGINFNRTLYFLVIFTAVIFASVACFRSKSEPPVPVLTTNPVELKSQNPLYTANTGTGFLFAEVGKVAIDQATADEWYTINLLGNYAKPVVIAQPPSFNDGEATAVRLRNVNTNSFELKLAEWADGQHLTEELSYLVIEAGSHQLESGVKIEAGLLEASHQFGPVSFSHSYTDTPIVLSQPQSSNNPLVTITRQKDVNVAGGFEVRLQRDDNTEGTDATETVGYIVVEQGNNELGDTSYVAGLTDNVLTNTWHSLTFPQSLVPPEELSTQAITPIVDSVIFLAGVQTYDDNKGNQTTALRYRNLDTEGVEVLIQPPDSSNHNPHDEVIGYVAFGSNLDIPTTGAWSQETRGNGSGSAVYDPNTNTVDLTVQGTGEGVTSQYIYQSHDGDFIAQACVQSLTSYDPEIDTSDPEAGSGLLLEDSSDPLIYVSVKLTSNGTEVEYVDNDTGTVQTVPGQQNSTPVCYKIERKEDSVLVYESDDGLNWVL